MSALITHLFQVSALESLGCNIALIYYDPRKTDFYNYGVSTGKRRNNKQL